MRLSFAAELGVRGMLVLSKHYGEGPVTLDAICSERDLPKQYLTKIFGSLTRADLVSSIRGKRGGYMLTREPGRITLLEVVEAVEGPIVLNFCQHIPPQCDRKGCRIRPIWRQLQRTIRDRLGSMTLRGCMDER
ncbi:MAG TPA: Rrf2 family transcriptional regulator [Phycisphaerae bacterium]|nr:Rrf2 family transcriptional regulator [Phycisphaerae bacterium]